MLTTYQHTAPSKLSDKDLEALIRRTFLQLESIQREMKYSWNKPNQAELMAKIREQLTEHTEILNSATHVWQFRYESMR
jgi:hypothetical protein